MYFIVRLFVRYVYREIERGREEECAEKQRERVCIDRETVCIEIERVCREIECVCV